MSLVSVDEESESVSSEESDIIEEEDDETLTATLESVMGTTSGSALGLVITTVESAMGSAMGTALRVASAPAFEIDSTAVESDSASTLVMDSTSGLESEPESE